MLSNSQRHFSQFVCVVLLRCSINYILAILCARKKTPTIARLNQNELLEFMLDDYVVDGHLPIIGLFFNFTTTVKVKSRLLQMTLFMSYLSVTGFYFICNCQSAYMVPLNLNTVL